jgi:hypothetical protein
MSLLKKPSILVLIFTICFALAFMDLFRQWHSGGSVIKDDIAQYYSYLPAYFYNNGSMDFHNGVEKYLNLTPSGEYTAKMTYGMSALYSPFFLLAHKIAANEHAPQDGFSEPYSTCIHWGCIFYAILGLFFLRRFLICYFKEQVVATVMVLVFFGTNLFAYSISFSEMSHAHLFMLFSALLWLSNSFYKEPRTLKFIFLGILLGLISIIRPVDIIFSLIFFLWDVTTFKELKERILFYVTNYRSLITAIIVVLIWIPQCLFWKQTTGHYIYFSYVGESFFWTDPQISNILFSYRKGWLLYSPMILMAFSGFFFMKKQHFKNKYSIIIVLSLVVYIYSCWWDWGFGGGFSGRSFVAYISILSFPLAVLVERIFWPTFNKYILGIKTGVFAVMFFFIFLNIGQTYQLLNGLLHHCGMTKTAYWTTFGKFFIEGKDSQKYWGNIDMPNYQDWLNGKNRSK